MKKRTVLTTLLVVAALGTAAALAQAAVPATTQSAAPAAPSRVPDALAAQGVTVTGNALPNAFSADRFSFPLAGFGRVGYYADTSGTGRPLLLLTSINAAASAYEVRPLFQAYRGTRPVYAMEWPGFASSDRPDIRYSPTLMTRALRQMVNLIGTDVDVVALSLGSEFAARAALEEPRIRTLALISPTGLGAAQGGTQVAAATQKAENLYGNLSNPLWASPLYTLISSKPSIFFFLKGSFEGRPDDGLVEYSYVTSHQPGARYAPLHFIGGLLFTPDAYTQLYSRVTQPTLVLYDRDAFVNFDRLPEFTASHPNAQAVRVTPTRGLPQFEQLGKVTAALDAFWAAQK